MITYTFGLTGGIASGKSTVANLLKEMGVPIIDADDISREIMEPGKPALELCVKSFGPTILHENGTLNRKALGQIVMSDPEARSDLNAICHPLIRSEIKSRIDALHAKRKVAVVVEAALLIETGGYKDYHGLILVTCTKEQQLQRLIARDGHDEDDAHAWINAQMSLDEKKAIAEQRKGSWIIENDHSPDHLREKVLGEWPQYYRVISSLLI